MAIYFYTDDPKALLDKFDAAIGDGSGKGSITTWEKVDDDYTHKAEEWKRKAYFEPHIDNGRLRFAIIKNKGTDVSVDVYAYYHGHLIETFLRHFDKDFSRTTSSALASSGDLVSSA